MNLADVPPEVRADIRRTNGKGRVAVLYATPQIGINRAEQPAFVARIAKHDHHVVRFRVDDINTPEFWIEFDYSKEELRALLDSQK